MPRSTVNNNLARSGGATDLNFKGTNNLTLNGTTDPEHRHQLPTINVEAINMTATLGGVISGTGGNNYGITKTGLGTLTLANNNTFAGGVTLNGGTLVLAGFNGGSTCLRCRSGSTVTVNNGLLALLNNGAGSSGVISYPSLNINYGSNNPEAPSDWQQRREHQQRHRHAEPRGCGRQHAERHGKSPLRPGIEDLQ